MKIAVILIVIGAVIFSGCTSPVRIGAPIRSAPSPARGSGPAAGSPAVVLRPTLTGTWNGTLRGYHQETGFTGHEGENVSMVVDEQHERIFTGSLLFADTGWRSDIAGVIGRDNRTLSILEKSGGYASGTVSDGQSIDLIALENPPAYAVAAGILNKV